MHRKRITLASRASSVLGRVAIVIGLVVALLATVSSPVSAHESQIRDITLPVPLDSVGTRAANGVNWTDTYGAPRGGGRSHEGVDMLGPKLTPLLAAKDGFVSWIRFDNGRGNNLVITDDDGWEYHYIHINNDSPDTDDGLNPIEWAFSERIAAAYLAGQAEGLRVSAGEVVAYMGDSGNAESCCSHLHFEIVTPDGANINPTPSVNAALDRGGVAQIELAPTALGPYGSLSALIDDLYGTLYGRSASDTELAALVASLGSVGFEATLESFISDTSPGAQIDRLYVAFFLRLPDPDGYHYWIDTMASKSDLISIAENFALSQEFEARYGGKDFGDFLDQLYQDVLFREPDAAGKAYWLDKLKNDSKVTRGSIVVFFTEGDELRQTTSQRSEFVALTSLLENRMPSDAEIAAWIGLRAGMPLDAAITQTFLTGVS